MTTATGRVRAPDLRGAGGWINTDIALSLLDLRGRVVVLDFWTFCCINCLRVVEELRGLEQRFGDRLVVIGVHSPKFPHEADHAAVVRSVARHRIAHPVLDDPELETWQQYGVRAWPTLVVIDPDGYVVAMASGEGNGQALGGVIERLLEGRDDLAVGAAYAPLAPRSESALAFPGKVASDGGDRIAVADTGHDRVLVCDLQGHVQHAFDGFHQPQGVRFDRGRLLVCDTVAGEVIAVAFGGGERQMIASGLRSPWDCVSLDDGRIAIAEAGSHRIVAVAGDGGTTQVIAGTGAEGLRDGPAASAHLAQPSGLTRLPGDALAFADSEVSALRVLRDGSVETLVGHGLFEWGTADGARTSARLQHPLGVAALAGGTLAVADTFNSLLRIWDRDALRTLRLSEPLDEPCQRERRPRQPARPGTPVVGSGEAARRSRAAAGQPRQRRPRCRRHRIDLHRGCLHRRAGDSRAPVDGRLSDEHPRRLGSGFGLLLSSPRPRHQFLGWRLRQPHIDGREQVARSVAMEMRHAEPSKPEPGTVLRARRN
jgi:thiol-disulfide isomerase/thioredoxin